MAAIVGIITSLVCPAIEIGKHIISPIKRQFNYLCYFDRNIQSLRDEAQNLEDKRVGLQREVDAAENNAEVIVPEVKTWFKKTSSKIQVDKRKIDDEIPTVKTGCWGIKSRYLLSKKAVKITGEMKQLMEDRNRFNTISTPPLPAAQVPIPLGTTYHEFQSRKQIEKEIMEALKEFRVMGICGMGGVGKTTMAKRIMRRAREEENMFDEIFMVVVSQQVDMLKIQGAIAESLGLRLGEQTLSTRASKLRARLTGTKRILIVLDDVWEKLKLEDLGIPCGNELHEGCTILLTSRNRDVLNKIDVQKACAMETLAETEACFLFREKAGTCVDDPNLFSIAKKVAKECKGLPIALITVGGALKDEKAITFWEDALQQLKSSNPEDVPDVIKDVYNPLKLSYTYLENRHAKSLFLLCSLFPEDVNISLEELTWYCMGLRMFEAITNLKQVRKRVFTIADKLKNRFLLLEGRDERHVRMHDVVRDVAIYIASKEAKEGIVDVKFNLRHSSREYAYEWVSVFSEELSSLLRMHAPDSNEMFEIKDFSIFKGIKQLNLLSFECILLKSLPPEIQLLKNLRTLLLYHCPVESLSVVGELLSLEILYCYYCGGIEELPVEIGNLNQLKLLEFSYCTSLRTIPPGIISNLVELEEFKIFGSFSGWESAAEVQGKERRNACLNEFENLSKLTCLEIEINDFNLAAEEIRFSPNIVKYIIKIGKEPFHIIPYHHGKSMSMKLPREINLGSWVLRFLKSANELDLKGDASNPLDLPQARNMKLLIFEDCSTVKELVNSTSTSIDDDWSNFDVFPILECLYLSRLPNLEEVYDGPVLDQSINSFQKLEWLYLDDLPALKHLCKRPNRDVLFNNLRRIEIRKCNNLLNLFSFTTSIGINQISTGRNVDDLLCTQKILFPVLEILELETLDKLEEIWNAPIPEGSNSFKNLRELRLSNLPAMTHLWKNPCRNISLSNLSTIHIHECHKLQSLFSSTILMDFVSQLARLEMESCDMMEQVLLNEENENDRNQCRAIQFPKLLQLKLHSLESLIAFSKGIESIEFPMLDSMVIRNCPKLMSLLSSTGNNQNSTDGHGGDTLHLFCSQKVIFGNLKEINISACHDIRSLFSSSISEGLVNLKELRIKDCNEMVKVIEDDEEMSCEKPRLRFPSLKKLILLLLPKLQKFCNWRCELQLPSLELIDMNRCLLLEFFTMKSVIFGNLKEINISACQDIRSLFSSSIAENLVNLDELKIFNCEEMVKVIEDDEEMSCEKSRLLFPSLKKLILLFLPKLQNFCNWRCDLQLPSLKKVEIRWCPLFEQFSSMGSVTTPNLKCIKMDSEETDVRDLNGAIQLYFEAYRRQLISTTEESTST